MKLSDLRKSARSAKAAKPVKYELPALEDQVNCLTCEGKGVVLLDGLECPNCGGTGLYIAPDAAPRVARRRTTQTDEVDSAEEAAAARFDAKHKGKALRQPEASDFEGVSHLAVRLISVKTLRDEEWKVRGNLWLSDRVVFKRWRIDKVSPGKEQLIVDSKVRVKMESDGVPRFAALMTGSPNRTGWKIVEVFETGVEMHVSEGEMVEFEFRGCSWT